MKRIINILTVLFLLSACSKDDGPIPERVSIEDVPVITTNLESGATAATITFSNQGAFQGKLKVALYFADAKAPAKVDVVVRKNGSASNVKLYKADVSSLPFNFTIQSGDLVTLFGKALAVDDTYDFGPDIYVGDKKYEAFPITGAGAGSGVQGMSVIGFGEYVRFTVK